MQLKILTQVIKTETEDITFLEVIVLSKNEEDYSDYLRHRTNLVSTLSLLAGFTFTVITMLLTQLPNPSRLQSQLTLFFLAVLFDLFVFLVEYNRTASIRLCRKVPPLTRAIAIDNGLISLGVCLWGVAVTLMFLLWDLTFLAIASGVVWAAFMASDYIFIMKPFQEHRKTIS